MSEEDFRMINYDELPTIQLVVDRETSFKQDSSTTTTNIETKDFFKQNFVDNHCDFKREKSLEVY